MTERIRGKDCEDTGCCATPLAPQPFAGPGEADFPPPFAARFSPPGADVFEMAARAAQAGELGAADILWSADDLDLCLALVLEPDVAAAAARAMREVMLVAVRDALSSLLPPQVGIGVLRDGSITVNDGRMGTVRMDMPPCADEACPPWMVVGAHIRLRHAQGVEGGQDTHVTVLAEEGGAHIPPAAVASEIARHFLTALDTWRHEGEDSLRQSLASRV